jgi:formylglycine-generating enzyme required for sulfatase activity
MQDYRRSVDPVLKHEFRKAPEGSSRRLRASLALLPADPAQIEYLFDRMLDAEPADLLVIRDALKGSRGVLDVRLWGLLEDPRSDPHRGLSAACVLADYDSAGSDAQWAACSPLIAERLLASLLENPSRYSPLLDALRPVRERLLTPLAMIFRDSKKPDSERFLATSMLGDYAADRPETLAELLMDSDPRQFAVLFPRVQVREQAWSFLESELARKTPPEATDEEKDKLAQRQANAAVALVRLDRADQVWPLLRHGPDPSLRSYIANRLKPLGADPRALVARLESRDAPVVPTPTPGRALMEVILFHPQISVRRALILALGEYEADRLPLAVRAPLLTKLLEMYRNDPDSGIHGAAGWTLRRWRQDGQLDAADAELKRLKDRGDRRWYLNSQGQTLAIIEGPVEFTIGSPSSERDRYGTEISHRKRITRRFAIGVKEISVEQFQRFLRANRNIRHSYTHKYTPDPQGPQISVTWYEAAAYCNWLSLQEGLTPCYEPNPDGEYAERMKTRPDLLVCSGYRLPTDAEWEYACRSGTVTSRYYGRSVELLGKYAWYAQYSDERTWPCGLLRPNDVGLFDMLGNVYEWCQDTIRSYTPEDDREDTIVPEFLVLQNKDLRVLRGGAFFGPAADVRSAFRNGLPPSYRYDYFGFRPARTY